MMGRRARWRGADAAKSSKCCMPGWLCQTGQDKFLIKASLHVFLWLDPLLSPPPLTCLSPLYTSFTPLEIKDHGGGRNTMWHSWYYLLLCARQRGCECSTWPCLCTLANRSVDPTKKNLILTFGNVEKSTYFVFFKEFFFSSLFCIEAVWKGYKTKL